jgi:membrane-associated phospholipid phosphatase
VKRSTVFYWLIGIIIAALVITVAFSCDAAVSDFIMSHQNRTLRRLMQAVSRFGDWPAHAGVGLALLAVAWWRGNKKWTRIFLSMLIALAIAGVVGRGVKIATGRARPSVKTEQVWNGSRFSSKFHAFPSGHVAASTAFLGVLFFVRRRVALAFLPIPIVIGFSRIYVGAHYLSDVVCAAVLGVLCALLMARVFLRQIET